MAKERIGAAGPGRELRTACNLTGSAASLTPSAPMRSYAPGFVLADWLYGCWFCVSS
jgi:hypothetical protein